MKWHMYVVEGKRGKASIAYCGIAKNPEKRCAMHNAGKGAKAVKGYLPVTLVATWPYPDHSSALKAEAAFKKLTRLQKQLYIKHPETWKHGQHQDH